MDILASTTDIIPPMAAGVAYYDLFIDNAGGHPCLATSNSKIISTDLNGRNQTDVLTSLNSPFGVDILPSQGCGK